MTIKTTDDAGAACVDDMNQIKMKQLTTAICKITIKLSLTIELSCTKNGHLKTYTKTRIVGPVIFRTI